ncbi:hypothetical protein B1H10_03390 [candidate division KSB1 bacterium 4484_188]|nr:MAG: hypothetical protein B1H10_03390 [candidate division KSB1 bacterium 4484_188]
MNWDHYRNLFPHLSHQIYFNHAGISPMNTRSQTALEEFYRKRLDEDIEFWPEAIERKQLLKERIGQLINAPAENIALVGNTSAGLNVLALGLDWKPGDRILLNDFEFPSNVVPFINLQRKGVEVDFVHHREGRIEIEDLVKNLHHRTRLVSISFVEFLNGFKNDLTAIGEICRERGIIFAVDAIQGLGALQMNMSEMRIDFLASGGHKWLMWPAGLGFVYIAPHIFKQVYPAQAGWLSVKTPWEFFNYRQEFAPDAQRFEPGTFNTGGVIAATATVEMMLEIGAQNIQKKVLGNTEYLIGKLQDAGMRIFTDTRPEHRSAIVTFEHPQAEALFDFFKKNRITVSLREGRIRVSPHFYNNRDDIDVFLQTMKKFKPNL